MSKDKKKGFVERQMIRGFKPLRILVRETVKGVKEALEEKKEED